MNDIVIIDDALEIILAIDLEGVDFEDFRVAMAYVGAVAPWDRGLRVGIEVQAYATGDVVTQDAHARPVAPNSVSGSISPSGPLGERA